MQHLKQIRLQQVQDLQMDPNQQQQLGTQSISSIAQRFGFTAPNHSACDYKTMFGESPSQTFGLGRACIALVLNKEINQIVQIIKTAQPITYSRWLQMKRCSTTGEKAAPSRKIIINLLRDTTQSSVIQRYKTNHLARQEQSPRET